VGRSDRGSDFLSPRLSGLRIPPPDREADAFTSSLEVEPSFPNAADARSRLNELSSANELLPEVGRFHSALPFIPGDSARNLRWHVPNAVELAVGKLGVQTATSERHTAARSDTEATDRVISEL